STAPEIAAGATLSAAVARPPAAGASPAPAAPAVVDADAKPLTSDDVAGHRLLTLGFDTSSMQPEDVQQAADAAIKWIDEQMAPADLVAVASIGSRLEILKDFTTSKEDIRSVLTAFSGAEATAFGAGDASTASTDEANANAAEDTSTVDASPQELDTFNN